MLQAAHISPYDGPATNRVSNGLLLRADLHNLFDRGLLWIDDSYRHLVRCRGAESVTDVNGRLAAEFEVDFLIRNLRPDVTPALCAVRVRQPRTPVQ